MQRELVKVVEDSGIAFDEFGWVGKVAPLINQKPQKVGKWMVQYMPEFYEKRCFKRKPLDV